MRMNLIILNRKVVHIERLPQLDFHTSSTKNFHVREIPTLSIEKDYNAFDMSGEELEDSFEKFFFLISLEDSFD